MNNITLTEVYKQYTTERLAKFLRGIIRSDKFTLEAGKDYNLKAYYYGNRISLSVIDLNKFEKLNNNEIILFQMNWIRDFKKEYDETGFIDDFKLYDKINYS